MIHEHEAAARIRETGLVAILRADSGEKLARMATALYEGGIDVIEVTLTTPNALEIISEVRQQLGQRILLGAGTILDPESARAALLAGAEFLVAPTLSVESIRMARRYSRLLIPGVFSPTEVLTALEAGASLMKLFPAEVAGTAFLKAIRGPLPQAQFIPTGGVTLATLPEFFHAGAVAVGLGGQLVPKQALETGDFATVTQLAQQFIKRVREVRGGPPAG